MSDQAPPEPGIELYTEQREWLEREAEAANAQATEAEELAAELQAVATKARRRAAGLQERLEQLKADMRSGVHTFDTDDEVTE